MASVCLGFMGVAASSLPDTANLVLHVRWHSRTIQASVTRLSSFCMESHGDTSGDSELTNVAACELLWMTAYLMCV